MALGFYFNQQRCIGCKTCQVACKDRNDLDVGFQYRWVNSYESGEYPNAQIYHYSYACNHCDSPACVANCPTGSMQKAEDDGVVLHDDAVCIGCGTCVESCAYGIPVLFEEKGIAGKCDSCKALRGAGMNPVCVDACPMRALDFGDVDALSAKYGTDLVRDIAVLPSSEETLPNTYILAKAAALEASYEELQL